MEDSETQRFKNLVFGSETKRNIVIIVSTIWFFSRVYTTGYADNNEAYWLLNNSVKFSILLIPFLGIILALSMGQTFISKSLNLPFLILLGESSYSLVRIKPIQSYLTHSSA